jgi:hypothetical protein
VNDPLVEAIDAVRENQDDGLCHIVSRMIMAKRRVSVKALTTIREAVYMNLAECFFRNTLSIDIARMLPTIIKRRIDDHFRSKYRNGEEWRNVVSIDELGDEPVSSMNVHEIVEQRAMLVDATAALIELRDSEDKYDQRDYQILEAYITETLNKERIQEIMGKEVSDTYVSTLLNRAKQRLLTRFESAGWRQGV